MNIWSHDCFFEETSVKWIKRLNDRMRRDSHSYIHEGCYAFAQLVCKKITILEFHLGALLQFKDRFSKHKVFSSYLISVKILAVWNISNLSRFKTLHLKIHHGQFIYQRDFTWHLFDSQMLHATFSMKLHNYHYFTMQCIHCTANLLAAIFYIPYFKDFYP